MLQQASSDRILRLAEVGSTNDWLKQHAQGLPDGQWVFADRQTGGRGRRGHRWTTLPGNLAASCLLQREHLVRPPAELGFVMALALYEACASVVHPARLMLKWPNDVLLDGAKLSGILLELEPAFLIAGVGVNLRTAPQLPDRATISLLDAGAVVTPPAFLELLAARFADWRRKWEAGSFSLVRAGWLARAHPFGTPLTVLQGGESLDGRFSGLAADGALLLETAGGRETIRAGDIWMEGPGDAARD